MSLECAICGGVIEGRAAITQKGKAAHLFCPNGMDRSDEMCPKGCVCDVCGAQAYVEIIWREFHGVYCEHCRGAILTETEHPPIMMLPIGEPRGGSK